MGGASPDSAGNQLTLESKERCLGFSLHVFIRPVPIALRHWPSWRSQQCKSHLNALLKWFKSARVLFSKLCSDDDLDLQICMISEELLKTEYDALRIVYNKFGSAVSFKPTIATVLSPDVSAAPSPLPPPPPHVERTTVSAVACVVFGVVMLCELSVLHSAVHWVCALCSICSVLSALFG